MRAAREPVAVTADEARGALAAAERCWNESDPEGLIALLHPEVRIRFNDLPEVRGRDDAHDWIVDRMSVQVNYRLEKTLRAVDGPLIVGAWTGRWQDRDSRKHLKARGIELLTVDDGLVRDWDAVMLVSDDEAGL